MKNSLKVTGSLICAVVISASTFAIPVFASPGMENKKVSESEEINKTRDESYIEANKTIIGIETENDLIKSNSTMQKIGDSKQEVPAYPDGTTRIVNYSYPGYGIIDTEEDRASGILNAIKGVGMTVAGVWVSTAGGVIMGAADVASSYIDFDRYATAKTFKSYRYIGKETQVYTSYGWDKFYDARSRQIYKHYFGTYVTDDNSTRTDSTDYTHDRGYSPVRTNYSPNFNNEAELRDRGWYNWYMGGGYNYPEYY